MTEHKNIYMALCAAQLEFGTVTKGSVNPAFRSRYADLADVAAVVIPTLAKHDVAVMHYIVGDAFNVMRTEFVHGPTETKICCDVPLIVNAQNMQGMKSATTYAKRIGLESLSGVAPEDDDGNGAATAAPKAPSEDEISKAIEDLQNAENIDALVSAWQGLAKNKPMIARDKRVQDAKEHAKTMLSGGFTQEAAQ